MIDPQPMPPWRIRQAMDFVADAPAPIYWGTPFRASAWVLAFIAVAAMTYQWGFIDATRSCIQAIKGIG